MYAFIWHRLPGNTWQKLTQVLVVVAAIVTLLWMVVFPWAEPLLPFDDVQVGTGTETGDSGVPFEEPPYPTAEDPQPSLSGLPR